MNDAHSDIRFIPMPQSDLSEAFSIYKSALFEIVEAAFGWDEKFQLDRFQSRYEPDWFYWLEVDSENIGFICFHQMVDEMHLSLLILFADYQKQKLGGRVMHQLEQVARERSLKRITLSSFINNARAIDFYNKLGYRVVQKGDHFLDMVLDLR